MCRSKGFVITLLGRRRFLPSINSNNAAQRGIRLKLFVLYFADLFSLAQAERQAVNTKIQGSAADLVKTAVILLNRSLKEKLADVHLVHQIHDELLFEVCFTELKIRQFIYSIRIANFRYQLTA